MKKSWVMDGWEKNKKNKISHVVGEEKREKGSMIPKNVFLGVHKKFSELRKNKTENVFALFKKKLA